MRRVWVAALGAIAALAAVAAIAMAQTSVPTVAVTATPTSVTATPAGPLAAGPTKFTFTRSGTRRGMNVYVALLVPGVSLADLQAALARDDRTRGESALGLVSIQASVDIASTETSRTVTFNLKPGLTYVMVSEPETENGPPPSRGFSTFSTTTASNGATAPAPNATLRLSNLRFHGSTTLPRRGVVRVTNDDGVPHFVVAFPLRRGVTRTRLGRVMRSGNERAIGRLVSGTPLLVQNLFSGGGTTNDDEVTFSKAGRYALVCFFNDHEELGMYRIVTVR